MCEVQSPLAKRFSPEGVRSEPPEPLACAPARSASGTPQPCLEPQSLPTVARLSRGGWIDQNGKPEKNLPNQVRYRLSSFKVTERRVWTSNQNVSYITPNSYFQFTRWWHMLCPTWRHDFWVGQPRFPVPDGNSQIVMNDMGRRDLLRY